MNSQFGSKGFSQQKMDPQQQSYYGSSHSHPYYVSYQCDEHQEIITNFCQCLDCLKPLCPDCVQQHFNFHKQNQTHADIESIKNVKIGCSKKIKAAISKLNKEMENCQMQYLIDPQGIFEEGQSKLDKAKATLHSMIEQHFDALSDKLKNKVHSNQLKATDFEPIFNKINQVIAELEMLNSNLDQGNDSQTVKQICLLDLRTLMSKFESEIAKVVNSRELEPTQINVDELGFTRIKQELDRVATIQQNQY